jgi:hypothetical protein
MTQIREDLGRKHKLTEIELKNAVVDEKTEAQLRELIGLTLTLINSVRQYAVSLSTDTQSELATHETGERLLSAYLATVNLSLNLSGRLRELTNTLTPSYPIMRGSEQPDMFGGMGHFDLEGVYHPD